MRVTLLQQQLLLLLQPLRIATVESRKHRKAGQRGRNAMGARMLSQYTNRRDWPPA